ncbi:MAG: Flp/Fap pilin component [Chloroflexota bacterium]|jgi:pilus assembly protein Flp/PilA|nr:Flp/Fap pilin component [Chloroflexota bacterium]
MFEYLTAAVTAHMPEKEEGQGMVEYGLIIALVAVVAIAGLIVLGPKISSMFSGLGSSV